MLRVCQTRDDVTARNISTNLALIFSPENSCNTIIPYKRLNNIQSSLSTCFSRDCLPDVMQMSLYLEIATLVATVNRFDLIRLYFLIVSYALIKLHAPLNAIINMITRIPCKIL